MKNITTINYRYALAALLAGTLWMGCKKQFAEPTYAANATAVKIWFKADRFYTPKTEIFIDSTGRWNNVVAFPLVYDNDPNKYGFGNPYLPGKGSNALYMTTIYGRLPGGLTSDSGYYNVTIPKAFEFLPQTEGATQGVVRVIPQQVRLYRRDKTFYDIGISGEGNYNEASKVFTVEVSFDETAIGGPVSVKRKYRFAP